MQRRSFLKAIGALTASLVVGRTLKLPPPARPMAEFRIHSLVHDEITVECDARLSRDQIMAELNARLEAAYREIRPRLLGYGIEMNARVGGFWA